MNRLSLNRSVVTLGILVLLLSIGCSQRSREGDSGYQAEDVDRMLQEAAAGAGSDFASINDGAWVYFAESGGSMGGVATVLALDNLDFLGATSDLYYGNIAKARVFYLDKLTDQGHQVMLIVGVVPQGSTTADAFTYYTMKGTGSISDGVYEATLTGSNGNQVILRSSDANGDSLLDVIQLKVFAQDASGSEYQVGKFSSLVGYGP